MMLKRDTHKQQKAEERRGSYVFPNVALLDVPPAQVQDDTAWIEEQRQLLDLTLKNFNVRANVVHVTQGPSVTRFEVHPEPGVKVNKSPTCPMILNSVSQLKIFGLKRRFRGKTRSELKCRTARARWLICAK